MLEKSIKAEAARLGFELVGITTPEPPPHFDVFEAWLIAGRHGEMGYLSNKRSIQRRADPIHILPECKSILILGIRHPNQISVQHQQISIGNGDWQKETGDQPQLLENSSNQLPDNPKGRVASYAWGEDYHDVLPLRLQVLVAFIEAQVGHPVPNRWYTDTGPILERDLAQRAGLGWIGKNTCLINPHAGSYFLLAEILLGLELTPDQPFTPDHCGSCRRCLDACPTQCILPDRTIDASRCISYLTIELNGSIPSHLRPAMKDWIFGCDLCQQVCPWNVRFATEKADTAKTFQESFTPRPNVPHPCLIQELCLTPEEFNRKFKGSPIKRAKRRGYLRNVAVALGNYGDTRSVSVLAHALFDDPEPLVRGHSAWSLGQIGGSEARQILAQAEKKEPDITVLAEIRSALNMTQTG
jgi:epoxyqueuosine reductase